jgi:tRNA(Ile)-lysidine synthase
MEKNFKNYWIKNISTKISDRNIKLACSGGMDSVFLFWMLKKSQIPFEVLHINYQLRGADSDGDEGFINDLCQSENIPFRVKRFDTKKIQSEKGKGIQEIARDLRYQWFREIIDEENAVVLTAHHQSDSIETSLFNFFRGSSLKGLTGIKNDGNRHIYRPLLFCTKESIKDYLEKTNISYREDASNAKNDYSRNKIRNLILPKIKEIFSDAEQRMQQTQNNLKEIDAFLETQLEFLRKTYIRKRIFGYSINKKIIEDHTLTPHIWTLLLKEYSHFSSSHFTDLQNYSNGKIIEGSPYSLVVGREEWHLWKKDSWHFSEQIVCEKALNGTEITKIIEEDFCTLSPSFNCCLDLDKIVFPISIRQIKPGDFFYPEGFHGKKKLKDFLNDKKFDLPEKERILVLTDKEKILAIIGHKMDKRAHFGEQSQKKLQLKIVRKK